MERKIENIIGWDFMVPSIVGLGSGEGFGFKGLHLPLGWYKATAALMSPLNVTKSYTERLFPEFCETAGLPDGNIDYDPQTGVLTQMTVETRPQSRLFLDYSGAFKAEGRYQAENINNIMVAIIMLKFAAENLALIGETIGLRERYAWIEGQMSPDKEWQFHSLGLSLPQDSRGAERLRFPGHAQRQLELVASNIAGRFGSQLGSIYFDNGILLGTTLRGITSPSCFLDKKGNYVIKATTPQEAVALHGITAEYLNCVHDKSEQGFQ